MGRESANQRLLRDDDDHGSRRQGAAAPKGGTARQEQLKALGVEDTLDPKFKPPMEPIEVLKVQIGHGQSKGNEAKEDSKTQSTLKETNHEREQQKEQERKREEQARKKEDAMKPRPFDEKLESWGCKLNCVKACS